MATTKIDIIAKNKASAALGKVNRDVKKIETSSGKLNSSFKKMAGLAVGVATALGGLKLAKDFLATANMFEQLNIQLKYITGSAEDGAKALDTVREAAKRSAFSLESMAQATPILLTVSSVDQLNDTLDITGDIAAATGMSFEEVASQLQRSFSGGIAAADMFREKGVKSMLGFQEGVKYSAEETEQIIRDLWKNNETNMKGAMEEMSKTFTAQVGMLGDAWLDFKQTTMEAGVFPALKAELGDLRKFIKDHEKEIEQYAIALGENIGEAIIAIGKSIKFIADNGEAFKKVAKALVIITLAKWLYAAAAAAYTLGNRLLFAQAMAGPKGWVSIGIGLAAMGTSLAVVNSLLGDTADEMDNAFKRKEIEDQIKAKVGQLRKLEDGLDDVKAKIESTDLNMSLKERYSAFADADGNIMGDNFKAAMDKDFDKMKKILEDEIAELNAALDEIPIDVATNIKDIVGNKMQKDLLDTGGAIDGVTKSYKDLATTVQDSWGPINTNTDMLTKLAHEGFSPTTEMAKNFTKAITTSTEMLSHNVKVQSDYVHWQDNITTSYASSTDMLSHNNKMVSTSNSLGKNAIEIMQDQWIAKQKLIEQAKEEALFQKKNYKKQFDAFKAYKLDELDFSKMSNDKQKEFITNGSREVLRGMAQHNKKAFQLNKAFNLAEAIMSTAKGVAAALPNFLLAGIVGAMGAVQIATIASQQYTGRRFGGPVSKGGGYIVGEQGPELFTPGATGRITSNEGMIDTRPVNVNFNIQATDASSVDELIVARRGMIVNMVRQATQERGNRPNF